MTTAVRISGPLETRDRGGGMAELIRALGFAGEQHSTASSILRVGGARRAVAVFLDKGESPEVSAPRFSGQSPVTDALATADAENLPYAVVTRGT